MVSPQHQRVVAIHNRASPAVRSRSGFVTTKRALENYLHPAAIFAAGGGDLAFGDIAHFLRRPKRADSHIRANSARLLLIGALKSPLLRPFLILVAVA